ncbi:MAG: TetR family transcriptional regulator [Actinobacteria bacterium]|nr:MAG: TetR family transcriptional regulator [Actinomycetota bacterium]
MRRWPLARALDEQGQALLEAASRLLAGDGADALTVRRIAADAGCSTMGVSATAGIPSRTCISAGWPIAATPSRTRPTTWSCSRERYPVSCRATKRAPCRTRALNGWSSGCAAAKRRGSTSTAHRRRWPKSSGARSTVT